uniref:G-protein coupled receptors family 1 profile domain-containing protein n=1 Tax=Panagrolaimus davidi TaxID=227884 RepID=A0A914QYH6_9BILA
METVEDSLDYKEFMLFYSVGIFGICCSVASLIFILKRPVLHNAFGYICAAHATAEAGVLGIFTIWGAVITLSSKEVEESVANVIMAHILNAFYYGTLYFHLLKSVNRFCAIVFSIKYRILFSDNIAKILILFTFGMGFIHTIPLFWYNCNSYFSGTTYRFTTRTFSCESAVIFYDDFVTCCTTMSIALSCDIITFSYFRIRTKKANIDSRNDIKLALHVLFNLLKTSF